MRSISPSRMSSDSSLKNSLFKLFYFPSSSRINSNVCPCRGELKNDCFFHRICKIAEREEDKFRARGKEGGEGDGVSQCVEDRWRKTRRSDVRVAPIVSVEGADSFISTAGCGRGRKKKTKTPQ